MFIWISQRSMGLAGNLMTDHVFGLRMIPELDTFLLTYSSLTRKLRRAIILYYYAARYTYGYCRRIGRTLYSSTCHALFKALCTVFLYACNLVDVCRRNRNEVRSVLHISIISNKQFMLSRLLRSHGIKSSFLALNTDISDRLAIGYDYSIPYHISPFKRRALEFLFLWMVLVRYDVIHFHFNVLLSLDNGWEMEYLRKMRKILVFHFRGCDLRQKSINLRKNPKLSCCMECDYPVGSCDTDYQRNRIFTAMKLGDLFFVTTPDLKDFFPAAEHMPFIAPYGIDLGKVPVAGKDPHVFRIVTSSNHPSLDGVSYIRSAVQRLRSEGFRVELIEVVKKPYLEALSLYKSADLYAGKLMMGYYNNANIETMQMGIPNMSYIRQEFRAAIPDCPIINTTPGTIYENLKHWIQRPDELRRIGLEGPAFVRKYHDPDKVIRMMIDRYNAELKRKRAERPLNQNVRNIRVH